MSQPLDPNDVPEMASEYGWGPGIFQPGIAKNEGQRFGQADFGIHMVPSTAGAPSSDDNYARAVADRRTDPTSPLSTRNFECLGNPDRYGGQPPLVQAEPQPDMSENPDRFGPRGTHLRRER